MAFHRSVACLLALLAVTIAEAPTRSAARFAMLDGAGPVNLSKSAGIAVDMIRYDDYMKPNLTLLERAEIAANNTLARGAYFHNMIYGSAASNSNSKVVLQTPIYPGPGSYIMTIGFGTPTKTFAAITDTGSNLVWVQCATCKSCFAGPHPVFQPLESSSYDTLPCTGYTFCDSTDTVQQCSASQTCIYMVTYGDQSTSAGDLASETVTLVSPAGVVQQIRGVAFGCGHNNIGKYDGVDGLVGLGRGPLSLVSQLGSQIGDVFSYCLTGYYSGKASTFVFGSPGPVALAYTPLVTNDFLPSFYYVNVVGIKINDVPLSYPAEVFEISSTGLGGLILDSGTTQTHLDIRVYTPFTNELKRLIPYEPVTYEYHEICYRPDVSSPTFPRVEFQFENNVDLPLPTPNVFLPVSDLDYCLYFTSNTESDEFSIFGAVQMQNFQIAYEANRVGFAPRTC